MVRLAGSPSHTGSNGATYLRLRVSVRKPLLDIPGYGEEDMLHVEVRLGTLEKIAFRQMAPQNPAARPQILTRYSNGATHSLEELDAIFVGEGLPP